MALHFGKRENEINKPLNSGLGTQRYGAPTSPAASPVPAATVEPASTAATTSGSARPVAITACGGVSSRSVCLREKASNWRTSAACPTWVCWAC